MDVEHWRIGGILLGMGTREKITISHLHAWKRERKKIPVITCYDYSTARMVVDAGIDVILVGDTYAEVCLGFDSTISATIDLMLVPTAAVRRGAPQAFLIGDMPFMSYQVSNAEAVVNAGRFMTEGGCDCVKLEVDRRFESCVRAITRASIPVMAHLGLRPQSIHQMGGYRYQGKTADEAERLMEDARIMAGAGASALLLEAVTNEVAAAISEETTLPVIGCISGPACDGQVLVLHDVLGYSTEHKPGAVKTYASLGDTVTHALKDYAADIRNQVYPTQKQGRAMSAGESEKLARKDGPRSPSRR